MIDDPNGHETDDPAPQPEPGPDDGVDSEPRDDRNHDAELPSGIESDEEQDIAFAFG